MLDSYNVLDACSTPAQRAAVISGSTGLDVIWPTALAAALAAHVNIYIPTGNYTLTSNIRGLELKQGVGVLGDGINTKITKIGTGGVFYTNVQGPAMTFGTLSVDAQPGDEAVTVISGQIPASFSANDILVLNDLDSLKLDLTRRGGEFVEVMNVDTTTGVVNLWHPIKYKHQGGSGKYARLTKPTLLTGVFVRDMWIDGNSEIDLADDYVNRNNLPAKGLIVLAWCKEAEVRNLTFTNFGRSAIRFLNSYNCLVDNIVATNGGSATTGTADSSSSEGLAGFSYVIQETALNQGLKITNVRATACRHVYTTTAVEVDIEQEPRWNFGEPYGTVIENCQHYNAKNMAFDTHEMGRNITFRNCVAMDCHYAGFQVRTDEVTIQNCSVINAIGPAIWIRGSGSGNAFAKKSHVLTVTVKNTNLGSTFDTIDWTTKGSIVDDANDTCIDGVNVYATGGPAIQMGDTISPNNATYSNINIEDAAQKGASNKHGVFVKSIGSTGACHIEDVRATSSDGKMVDVVYVASSASSGTLRVKGINGTGNSGLALNNASTGTASIVYNADMDLRIERGPGSAQYTRFSCDSSANRMASYSPASAAKNLSINVTTDAVNTTPTSGNCQFVVGILGVQALKVSQDLALYVGANKIVDASGGLLTKGYTATTIGKSTDAVNTTDKVQGKMIFNTSVNKPMWATGASATAPWNFADGATPIVPTP